ncbi:MAG TPA: DUF1329 domain-containing protein [Candidatus Binataceae bacterium]|nr:DUF1329 domain-containing protein [Candidatus Binataceae bacterium]HVB80347.1 DUF1329 domain-containing protein [Candidatus Binataceae bacterium]
MKQLSVLIGLGLTMLMLGASYGSARAGASNAAGGDIPPGTKITMQNWHQYAAFMPTGMQALFEGKYYWKMPADIELVVAPTVTHPLPLSYRQATERYASRVKLVSTPDGGLQLRDYVAGMPFPNPEEPHKGWKILANLWYRYFPHLVSTSASGFENLCREDRFSDLACSTEFAVYRQLRHIADTGSSLNAPGSDSANGPSFTEFWMIETPENQKYTSGLTLYYDSRPQDDYIFTPKLRRALRINASARCSESSGSDFMEDDWRNGFSGDIWEFQAHFVTRMKMLTSINFGTAAGNLSKQNYYFPLLWPRPTWAKFELRDTNVIDVRPLPKDAGGYCYGKRVMYIDANSQVPLWEDLYDSHMKLWKVFRVGTRAREVPGAGVQDSSASRVTQLWNLKTGHVSFLSTITPSGADFALNNQVPKQYDDIKRYSGLSGLNEIMR